MKNTLTSITVGFFLAFANGVKQSIDVVDLQSLVNSLLLGLIGAIGAFSGKELLKHFRYKIKQWKDIRRAIKGDSIAKRNFWYNTLYIAIFWILIISLAIVTLFLILLL